MAARETTPNNSGLVSSLPRPGEGELRPYLRPCWEIGTTCTSSVPLAPAKSATVAKKSVLNPCIFWIKWGLYLVRYGGKYDVLKFQRVYGKDASPELQPAHLEHVRLWSRRAQDCAREYAAQLQCMPSPDIEVMIISLLFRKIVTIFHAGESDTQYGESLFASCLRSLDGARQHWYLWVRLIC